ncbi:YozQ family protein [Brevibacillus migulae]|uniref:YozQ family protein n=1 Tax=Brevibacillus migulae TaxID=1644114 RepID=UPI00106E02C8|nr:YozQ family protein [Brevibacillus migulae]
MKQSPNNKELQKAADVIAQESYSVSDYASKQPVEQGLAVTHEQVSDDYMEGTNDGKIDEVEGKQNVEIPRTGYEGMFTQAAKTE